MMVRHLAAGAVLALTMAAPLVAQTPIPLARFKSVELQGGGKITLRQGNAQRVTLMKGSTDFTEFKVTKVGGSDERLVIAACRRQCPPRYQLEIVIETPNAPALAVKGGGQIAVQPGFPQQSSLAAAVSGGGGIEARSLPARNVAASVNGGGSISVKPLNSLAASVRGGGIVKYWGNPVVTRSVRGGGSIQQQQ